MRRVTLRGIWRAIPAADRFLLEGVLVEAQDAGWGVSLVGGPVRDFVLGQALRDVDLVVEADAIGAIVDLVERAAPSGARRVLHERFGTARIEEAEARLDLACARSEAYRAPGALPQVRAAPLESDLLRRDFSVNAMAVPLNPSARRGRRALVDPCGGLRDLEIGRLRVLHSRSFHDDPTRALRAARFAARFDLRPDRATRRALRMALREGAFGAVTGARFLRELEKLFADAALGADPGRSLRALADWGVLASLAPGLELPGRARASLRRLGRFLREPAWGVRPFEPWVSGLMVWMAELPRDLPGRVLTRLDVRGERAQRIVRFGALRRSLHRRLAKAPGRGATDALLAPLREDELVALFVGADASLRRRIARFGREDRPVRLPLSGRDLLQLGLSGVEVGQALSRLRVLLLDGRLAGREEALALARAWSRGERRVAPDVR